MRLRRLAANGFFYGYLLLAALFILTPILVLIIFSFNSARFPRLPLTGFTLEWYTEMFANDVLMRALVRSFFLGIVTGLSTTFLGFLAAYGLARYDFPLKNLVHVYLALPITVSYTIIALGTLIFFTEIGIARSLLAVWIAQTTLFAPISMSLLYAQLNRYQINLERAAMDLGANTAKALVYVTIPVILPSVVASFFLIFTFSWDEFIMAFFLSGFEGTLPVRIYEMLRSGLDPTINAVGTFVLVISLAATFIAFLIYSKIRVRQ